MTVEPGGRESLPVACTLGPADGRQRLDDWRALATAAGAGRADAAGAVVLTFRDLPGVHAELSRLVEAERSCCAFLTWELVRADGQWQVHVTGEAGDLGALPLDA